MPKRKPIFRANTTAIPVGHDKKAAIDSFTTAQLKEALRSAGIGIPKAKWQMVKRLFDANIDVAVATTTELVVFKPRK